MRTIFDPRTRNGEPYDECGKNIRLVDKLIGNAYDIVKYVASYLDVIRYVASNMEDIYEVAVNLKRSGLVLGQTGLANQTVSVAIPEGVTQDMILSSSVMLADATGSLFGSDSGYFTASIQAGALRVYLNPLVPVSLQNTTIRWFITYGV